MSRQERRLTWLFEEMRLVSNFRKMCSVLGMTGIGAGVLGAVVVLGAIVVGVLWVEFAIGKNWDADIEAPVVVFFTGMLGLATFAVDRVCQWIARLWRLAGPRRATR